MKNLFKHFLSLLFISLVFLHPGHTQAQDSDELKFEINRVLPYISITREELDEARSLTDLNKNFKSSWIKEYISIEILINHNGRIMKGLSHDDILTHEQKDIMTMADSETDISVRVLYMPKNTLKNNEPKEIDFSFRLTPENNASYSGGFEELQRYIKQEAIDKMADGSFNPEDLAAIKFTINKAGQIVNTHLVESSKDESIDALLLQTIRKMPPWKPAEYDNGLKIKQDFVLTVGNMKSCLINLLSIR
ncbi:MAG: energy transducer TonB [Saprospiraceae bacterium]|nr:energy transducer TonB [Saprospiraceae bacterium]